MKKMKPCRACKYYTMWNNGCDKFKIILSKGEVHDFCFEPRNPVKNPLEVLKDNKQRE